LESNDERSVGMARVNPQVVESTRFWGWIHRKEGILTGPSAIAWVIASALALRGIAWYQYDPVTFDSALYFEMAALFQAGRWSEALAYDYPPLYALLIAGLQPLLGTADAAGLFIAFVADLLILVPIVAIARRAVGEEAAWAAAFLWVVHPSAIRLGVQALSDAPAALCVAMALFVGLRAVEQRRLRWALVAGLVSGLAFLFRPEGLEPAVVLAVFYALQWHQPAREAINARKTLLGTRHSALGSPDRSHEPALSSRAPSAIRRAGWVLAPLAGWVLVAGPYVAHISAEAGTLTLSKKKSATSFVRSVGPLPSLGHQAPEVAPREERQPARSPGASWVHRSLRSVYVFQKPVVNGLTVVLIVPACMGLAGILTRRKDRWNPALGLLAGLFVLHFGILVGLAADKGATYLGRHHALLLVLYALPVAGAGLVWTLRWMGDRLRSHRWVPATALCIILVATGFAVVTRGPDQGRSLRTAAAWTRSQVVGTPVIVTSLAKLTYHAHAERVDIRGTYDEILRRGRERSAHFVALYPDLIDQTSPDFLARLSSADLELVKVFPEPTPQAPDQRLELYRLRAQETGTSKGP
jgi:Dolichyl-phosphate-mannose-protein mannosyltransferase